MALRFPTGAGNFVLLHYVQTGSGAHPASHSMDTGGSSPGDKATRGQDYMELHTHSTITPPKRDAQLKKAQGQIYPLSLPQFKKMALQTPTKNVPRSQVWRTGGPEIGASSSYPTIRKLPVQRGTNTTGEVKWCIM